MALIGYMQVIGRFLAGFFSFRFLLKIILLLGFLLGYWYWLGYQQFIHTPVSFPSEQKTLTIKLGDSVNLLARRWQDKGYINQQYYLRLFCALNPDYQQVKTGEYKLDAVETPESLMIKISQGKVIQYALTLVEGTNSFQIINQLKAEQRLNYDLPEEKIRLMKSLAIDSAHIEGWLFPDTYYFSSNASALSLLKRASLKMQRVLKEEWKNRGEDLPYKTPYEALIMASIIEKETAIASEREQIAGVFVRRLEKKMRLQTDPTVIYGIGENFNGDITRKDLRTKTPYNTYVIKGLPPTPIAMPGRESIYAALHPAPGKTLYFVASGDGGHYFSETLQEHNKAVKRYLRKSRR